MGSGRVREAAGPRDALRSSSRARIHGGIKAREVDAAVSHSVTTRATSTGSAPCAHPGAIPCPRGQHYKREAPMTTLYIRRIKFLLLSAMVFEIVCEAAAKVIYRFALSIYVGLMPWDYDAIEGIVIIRADKY